MNFHNPVKVKYQNHEPVLSAMVRFPNPMLAEIEVKAGAEEICIDNEHYPFTDEDIVNICRSVKALGANCTVRLGRKTPEAIYRVMDMGVDGVLLPNVETKEEAQMIVDAVKYAPMGKRGCCPITRGADYGIGIDVKEYYKKINDATTVGLMIESKKGYENLDEILSVKGIDYFVIGPSDFSGSFGKPGQAATDPEIRAAMADCYDRMKKAGFTTGGLSYTPEQTRQTLKEGKTFLNIGSDLQMLTRQFGTRIKEAKEDLEKAGLAGTHLDPIEKMRANEPVLTPFLRIAEPAIAEIMVQSGADFIILDDEHFPFTDEDIIRCIRAAHLHGGKVIVRPHDKSKAVIGRILDMGADGIMAPQVLDAKEAEHIVKSVKYSPEGYRGLCPITAGADYGYGHSAQEYAREMNKKTIVGIMIETKSAVEDLDNILKVPGVDFIATGPSDISASYGLSGQYDHPILKEVHATLDRKVTEANMPYFGFAYTRDKYVSEVKDGKKVLNIGSDLQYMIWGWSSLIQDIKKVVEEETR